MTPEAVRDQQPSSAADVGVPKGDKVLTNTKSQRWTKPDTV
jgi:hypothetical protein